MQKRIILALGISSIAGSMGAQEVTTDIPAAVVEQTNAAEANQNVPATIADTSASEPVESNATAAAPAQIEQPESSATPASLPATEPMPVPAVVSPEQTEPVKTFAQPVPNKVVEPEPEVATQDHAEDLEIKGIDTVNVAEPKGNWLYKRIWWEKAERTYEKIKQLGQKIQEARILYFARRTDLDRNTLDPFYLGQGFNQGELSEIIAYLTAQLEQERKDGTLDEKEQALLNALGEEKKNLENLQKGVKAVSNIDHALDDALLKLSEQLQQAQSYEQQAWENFKAINRELSDKRARELYYGMDTYWRNLNNINTYISDAFSQYFDQLTDRVKQEIEKIKTTMDALKEKGIDIQLQAQKLKAGKTSEPEEEAVVETTTESSGILGTMWHWVKAPFVAIADMVSGALGWITGSGATEELTLARPERSKTE